MDCNHKRLYSVYSMFKFNIRKKTKRRIPERVKEPLLIPEGMNKSWSMDFMLDSLVNARRLRLLNVMDDYNRERPHAPLGIVPPAEYIYPFP